MTAPAREPYRVHLARGKLLLSGAIVVVFSLLAAQRFWILGVAGLLCSLIILTRALDPRPQLVLDDSGATFGGLMKSVPWRDVHVPWNQVRKVGKEFDQMGEPPRLTKSTPFVPPSWSDWTKRMVGTTRFDVETVDGRTLSVYPPGHGLTLAEVRSEFVARWTRSRAR